jgi:hypothetical protein
VALKASFDFKQLGKGGPCSIGLHEVGVFESHPLLAQKPRSPPEPAFQRPPPFLAAESSASTRYSRSWRAHMSWHDRAFDDTATKVMGIAFDAVCEKMDGLAYSDVVKEIIAKRIIRTR